MASENLSLKSMLNKVIPEKYACLLLRIFYFGYKFTCPICNRHFRKFLPFGVKSRPNACCPGCRSLERHRLLWLYLRDKTNFFTDHLKVLHIAPMQILQEKFKKLENLGYISADISSPSTMIKMDITYINLRDNQFDCIICYHVLDYIPDDEKAMKELFRILKPDGWAILQSYVDPNLDKTIEYLNGISPEERKWVFGPNDNVRKYGRNYIDRLERAGFTVKCDNYVRELGEGTIKKYCLKKNEIIYVCTKPKK